MQSRAGGRIVFLWTGLLMALAMNAASVQVSLSNGTTFTGEIISQNENFIVVQVGQAKISLAKSMVTGITGLPAGMVVTGTGNGPDQSAAAAPVATVPTSDLSGATPGKLVEITLKNGAKYKGTVAAANDELMTLEMGSGAKIDFYKSIIVDIRYFTAPAPSPVAVPAVPSSEAGTLGATVGRSVEITLTTGAKYRGKVAVANEQMVTLESETGSRLNIYKHVIAGVHDLSPASAPSAAPKPIPPAPVVAAPVPAPPAPAAAPAAITPVPQTVQNAPIPAPVALSAPAPVSTPAPQAAPKPVPPAPVPQTVQNAPASAPVAPAAPAPAPVLAAPIPVVKQPPAEPVPEKPKPQTIQNVPAPVPAAPAPVPPAPMPAPLPVVAVTQPSAAALPPKRTDGKNELVLKNGTVFSGTVVSESDRFLTFSTSDGATINVLRRLIKSIDGVPYRAQPGAALAPADTSSQLQRAAPAVAANPSPQPMRSVPLFRRLLPNVTMRPNVSAAELVDSLKSAIWEQRSAAARELGGMGQWASGAISPLVALFADTVGQSLLPPLENDSGTIQKLLPPGCEAARALSRLGPTGVEVLKRDAHSSNPLVRQRAVFGLGEALDAGMQQLLYGALKDADPRVRATAAHALRFNDAVNALIGVLDDRDGEVRTYAAATLGDLQNPLAVKPLLAATKDVHPSTRAQAAAALGKIGAREATAALAAASGDASAEVREKAVVALGQIKDSAAVPSLLAALKDGDPAVRKAAAEALGDIRDPRAIPSLYASLQEPDRSVKAAMEIALKMHTEIPLLIGALDNQNSLVRDNAAYILWLMTGKNLGSDRQAWVDWYANPDREEAKKPAPGKAEDDKNQKKK
jgi:HEAT repeat protein/sRNA-binding regulator protein Hfq